MCSYKGYISTLTYANMMYVMRKQLTPDQIEEVFRKLNLIFEFADFSPAVLERAVNMKWKDFGDAVQSATAESVHADYIITRHLSAALPVDHTYDLLPECGWKNFAQKAQKFVLCTGHIKDGGFLFCHNICDEAADIFWGHAVLFIMFHAADTSGNSSAIVFVAEDVFLTRFGEAGADIAKFYCCDIDAIRSDFIGQCVRIG